MHGTIFFLSGVSIERDGHSDEAAILYKRIIETSTNGYKVRDAKYRLDKIETLSGYNKPEQWGLKVAGSTVAGQKALRSKIMAAVMGSLALIGAAIFFYRPGKPLTWTDVVENAKKSAVVVKTAGGAGSGFFISSDGFKIDGVNNQFLPLAGPDDCGEGEEIRAIGAPLGIEYFITKGIISHCNHARDGVRYLRRTCRSIPGTAGDRASTRWAG